ncbi:MAG: hypothetical protein AW12_02804 [Candidatus Accumulibacter sp. BA-94]|nr:MAG: hypothetical protein AW12_02804 [Candidatus Accumulibacter sp. BA-94]
MAVRHVLDGDVGEVEAGLLGHCAQPGDGTDEDRLDQPLAFRLQCRSERRLVTRMGDGDGYRRQLLTAFDEAAEVVVALDRDLGRIGTFHAYLELRRDHPCAAGHDRLAAAVDATAGKADSPADRVLGGGGDRDRHLLADRQRRQELEILSRMHGPRTGKLLAEEAGNLRSEPHAVGTEVVRPELPVEFIIELGRAEVAGDGGEELHVVEAQGMGDAGAVADADFVETPVLEDV